MDPITNEKGQKIYFVDIIPDLRDQLGISSLEYLDVAINQSEYYGFKELKNWFTEAKKVLTHAVESEWDVEQAQSS